MGYTVVDIKRNSTFGSWAVGLERSEDGLIYWVNVSIDSKYGDIDADWNQYIFFNNNNQDVHRKAVQEDTNEFDMATSEAICFLEYFNEARQTDRGIWYCPITTEVWKNGAIYVCR